MSPPGQTYGRQILGLARAERIAAGGVVPAQNANARGSAIARLCLQQSAEHQRRVIVKVRFVSHGPTGAGRLGDHLRYLQRDGVSFQGGPGTFYGAGDEALDRSVYRRQCRDDPHHYRIIVSPEDGRRLEGMQPFIRDLMARAQADLGARLDWLAVDHYNTGLPHSHIVLRGRESSGGVLVIAPAYLRHGLRARARQLVGRELGPLGGPRPCRPARDRGLFWTGPDRTIAGLGYNRQVSVKEASGLSPEESCDLVRRLRFVTRLGLASESGPGAFVLARQFGETLRAIETRSVLMALLQREIERAGLVRPPHQRSLLRPCVGQRPLVGQVVAAAGGEAVPLAYLVLDATDGRTYLAPLSGVAARVEGLQQGMIVSLAAGREAVNWQIDIRSYRRLEALVTSLDPTWLDQLVDHGCRARPAGLGFAEQVNHALRARLGFLARNGILRQGAAMPGNLYRWLRVHSLGRMAKQVGERLGLDFCPPREGVKVSGRIAGTISLPSERLAILAGANRFTFVAWRPAFAGHGERIMRVSTGRCDGIRPGHGLGIGLGLGPALAGR
jgi:hypothetical protein